MTPPNDHDAGALMALLARLDERAESAERRLASLERQFGRQQDQVDRLLREIGIDRRLVAAEAMVQLRVDRYAATDVPILVGPWVGDPTLELLLWIPFVQWVQQAARIDPARVVAITRAGAAPWYASIAAHCEDVAAFASADDLRDAATARARTPEQLLAVDRGVLRQAMRRRAMRRGHVLHPAVMFALHDAARARGGLSRFERFLSFERFPQPSGDAVLPERYVAVHFVFSETFPETADNRWYAAATIGALAAQGDVVVLNDASLGGGVDFVPEPAPRVHLASALEGGTGLELQSLVLSRASAFVGTFGAYAYLAPRYGVPSVGLYTRRTFRPEHVALAERAMRELRRGRFTAIEASQIELLSSAFWAAGPGNGGEAAPEALTSALRAGVEALPWPERFDRLAIVDNRTTVDGQQAIAQLRAEMAERALTSFPPLTEGLPFKEAMERLEGAKRLHSAVTRAARDARDRLVLASMADPDDPLRNGGPLASGFAVGHDERVIELPLALAVAALDQPGTVLDAGAALNLPVVRQSVRAPGAHVTHFTQSGEKEPQLPGDEDRFTFQFGDLRHLPFADATFDRAVCISTLEHVGLDNTRYGGAHENDPASAATAVAELVRVVRPGGRILITVPYGLSTIRGWFRVFDAVDLHALLAPAAGDDLATRYFYYHRGWFEAGPEPPAQVLVADFAPDVVTGLAVITLRRRRTAA